MGGKWALKDAFPTEANGTSLSRVPGKTACFVVAFGLLGCCVFYLIKSEILAISLPAFLLNYGYWFITVIFFLRTVGDFHYFGIFKKIKSTPFGIKDTKIYTPLCILIFLSTLVLLFN